MAKKQLNDLFESSAKKIELPADDVLNRIGTLAKKQVELENRIIETEDSVLVLKKELDEIRDKQLPELLISAGLSDIKLTTGEKIVIDKMIFASITKEKAEACFQWLDKHGFGDIIKYKIEIDTGKGGKVNFKKIKNAALKLGLEPRDVKGVHPATLKAFISEQLEKAKEVPMDLFGVYSINRTKIK